MVSARKDSIGRRLAERPALADPGRPALVGLRPLDGATPLRAGAHLLAEGAPTTTAHDEGHVTAACHSPTLGHPIALALLKRGASRHGERIRVFDPVRGGDALAVVGPPCFLDPEGARTRG
jgi:sarcosine oxidase subunit alpha